jgi:hypothetical protein
MIETYCGLEVHELVLVIPKMSEAEYQLCSRVLLSRDLEGMVGGKPRRESSQKRAIRRLRDRDHFHRLFIGA